MSGDRVLAEARLWLNTPYVHQMSVRGVGCDCLGLIRGVWRALYGPEPETVPPYGPDWAESGPDERLIGALSRWLNPIGGHTVQAGDVVVFRIRPDSVAKHAAILSAKAGGSARMIHAYWGRAVVESAVGPWWRQRFAGAFRFPAGGGNPTDRSEEA